MPVEVCGACGHIVGTALLSGAADPCPVRGEPHKKVEAIHVVPGASLAEKGAEVERLKAKRIEQTDQLYRTSSALIEAMRKLGASDRDVLGADTQERAVSWLLEHAKKAEVSLRERVRHLQDLAPHEITCRCGEGDTFEWERHADDCPRHQVGALLSQQSPKTWSRDETLTGRELAQAAREEHARTVVTDFLDAWRFCPLSQSENSPRPLLEDAANQLLTSLRDALPSKAGP